MLERLRALRLPSVAIVSQLERDVLEGVATAAHKGDKATSLARWLVSKQRCGIPVFVVSVEGLLGAVQRMDHSEFVGVLRRAVAGGSAPHVLQRLLDNVHMVFSSPPPMNRFF